MNKEIITVGDIEIEKHKFHYSKYVININNAGVRTLVLVKRVFNNLFVANTILVIKMVKKLNHYVCSQKWVDIFFLMKQYMSFLIKTDELLQK